MNNFLISIHSFPVHQIHSIDGINNLTKNSNAFDLNVAPWMSVYSCDFDSSNNCGGFFTTNSLGLNAQFASVQSTLVNSYTITDLTSISIKI